MATNTNLIFTTMDGKSADALMRCLVANELYDLIGHTPTDTEIDDCFLYLAQNVYSTSVSLDGLENAIEDYFRANYTQCEECGEYFPTSHMEHVRDRFVCGNNLCNELARDEYNEWLSDFARRVPVED